MDPTCNLTDENVVAVFSTAVLLTLLSDMTFTSSCFIVLTLHGYKIKKKKNTKRRKQKQPKIQVPSTKNCLDPLLEYVSRFDL